MGEWDVTDEPHKTVSGDHPQMMKNARKPYSPASDASGDWGDVAPVSDGKSYKNGLADEMRNKGWGNLGGKDVFPDLKNPMVPDADDFVMKGEKSVGEEGDDSLGQFQGDTHPELKNPFILASLKPKSNDEGGKVSYS
jgi:hypothetical protein